MEITGLEVQDVDLQQACVHLRRNSIRKLKTKSSNRVIPLSSRALELLQQHRQEKEEGDPIFPDFAKRRGNDSASSRMMKLFRKSITDKRLSTHSLRHRMKDKLRNSGCQKIFPWRSWDIVQIQSLRTMAQDMPWISYVNICPAFGKRNFLGY